MARKRRKKGKRDWAPTAGRARAELAKASQEIDFAHDRAPARTAEVSFEEAAARAKARIKREYLTNSR